MVINMTNNEIAEVLERALARLDNGKAWTQRVFARNAQGVEVDPRAKTATCWCALGAVYAEVDNDKFNEVTRPIRAQGQGVPVTVINDTGTFEEDVRAMFERALEHLRAPGEGRS
jgi:hypothetical protein